MFGNDCQLFDGFTVSTTFQTYQDHEFGELGLYNGRPTAVGTANGGGFYTNGAVETLTEYGWLSLSDHPR